MLIGYVLSQNIQSILVNLSTDFNFVRSFGSFIWWVICWAGLLVCVLNFDYSKESYYYSNKFHHLEYFLEVEASILAKKPNKIHKGVAFRDFFFEKEVVWFPERVRKFKICSKAF